MIKKLTFNKLLFLIVFIICLLITLIFPTLSSFVVFFSCIFGIIATNHAKNGKWQTFLFDIISCILYLPICIKEQYVGELILSIGIIFTNFLCIKEWKRNTHNSFVDVYKINKTELKFISFLFMICFLIYLAILNKLKCEFAILNCVSTIFFILGNYFSYRRSILQFYSLIVYECAYILLWFLSATDGEPYGIILLLGGIVELIFDVIAIKKWNKISQLQKTRKCKAYMFEKSV